MAGRADQPYELVIIGAGIERMNEKAQQMMLPGAIPRMARRRASFTRAI